MTVDSFATYVLIDTQWNVNKEASDLYDFFEKVLIDTQWNVNIYHPLWEV